MARFTQSLCHRGSQRWIQWFVNHAPDVLNEQIGIGVIDWRSPLATDRYAEYRDQAFLDRLGVSLYEPLSSFWPRGGPQWDALGSGRDGTAVLVEAKAHINELFSPATGACETSLAAIQRSLRNTASALGVGEGFDWSKQFYQYGNRLAHAHFLQMNGVPVVMAFVYFVGDADVKGPQSRDDWQQAIKTVHQALGLVHAPPFVRDVFIDVRPFCAIPNSRPYRSGSELVH
jgi:hypothetical protein